VVNNSDTKRIAEQKIKSYPMNQIPEIGFALEDAKPFNNPFRFLPH
jgi:hypothetical protein